MLGNAGVSLTTIGLGTWAQGGGGWNFGWGPQDDWESIRAIQAAYEEGINWVDTAPVYGLGHAEEVLGRALRELPEQPFVATKCGLVWDDSRRTRSQLTSSSVRKECEASLRRLGVDVIDLYQIHWPNPDEQIEEAWSTIAQLMEEGKVRFPGVSNFSVQQLERVQAIHPVTSLQPPYSMLERKVETELLEWCARNGVGVIPYSPMQKGMLTGKVTPEWVAALPDDDHRKTRDPLFQEPLLTETLKKVEKLESMAEDKGIALSQLAIAWVLRREEVTAAIVGARRPEQIRETAKAADVELTADELEAIERVLRE